MNPADLAFASLAEIADRLSRREISSAEIAQAQLERIATLDPRLNAFITVTADRALAEAAAADARRAAGDATPLLGVPIALKDLFTTAGVRTTAGARILAANVPDADATVVRRLRQAGAVMLGKTNMMEFAYGYPHPDFGETVNPWALDRTTGGSSGGSAAAVASGMAYGALGSDTGGSIRSPAAYCGIVGLKPTYGLVSRAGVVPLAWSLDHVGPLTRTVRDGALLLDIIAGFDPADPASLHADPPRATSLLGKDVRGLRVGVVEAFFERAEPGVRDAARAAVEALAGLGVEAEPVDLAHLDLVVPTINPIVQAEAASYHWPTLTTRPEDYSDAVRQSLRLGATVLAKDYLDAQRARRLIAQEVAGLLERVDALVFPTQPTPAPALGSYVLDEGEAGAGVLDLEIAYTGLANLTGHPALSVPCGFTPQGLPVGLQFTGRMLDECTLLQLGAAFEAATPWYARRPLR